MKKIFLFLLLIPIYSNAQFATFTPYVHKPAQQDYSILQRSLEQLETRATAAHEQYSKLQMMLAEYGYQLYNDEATLIWFDKYKKEIKDNFYTLSEIDSNEARNYAVRMQGEILIDPELQARIRTSNEYRAIIRNIQERKDLSQEDKRTWIISHPYRFAPILNEKGKIIGGKLDGIGWTGY